jgi:hypothetical protein
MTLWTFAPNWRDSYHVTYEHKTDMFVSRSRREQRRALRTTPRKHIQFTVTLSGAEVRSLNRQMAKSQAVEWVVPDLSRWIGVTADVAAGDTIVHVDGSATWLINGTPVVIAYDGAYVAATAGTVIDGQVTLSAAVTAPWSRGGKLHPALTARLPGGLPVKLFTDTVIEAAVSFSVMPGTNPSDDSGSPAAVFNGREIFPFGVNWAQPLSGSFDHPTDPVDFGRGRIQVYVPIQFGARVRQVSLMYSTLGERAELVAFFHRMKGRRGEFYMPSLEPDMVVSTAATAGATTLRVTGADIADFEDTVHRAIVISGNGYDWFRKVTDLTVSGSETIITTDVGWPDDLPVGTVISWLLASRLGTDMLDVECVTDTVGRTQMAIQSLEDLPVDPEDNPWAGLDEGAEWLVSTFGWLFTENEIIDPVDQFVNHDYPLVGPG